MRGEKRDAGEVRFAEYSQFIKENYPGGKEKHQYIINTALDGYEVEERRDQAGNVEGILTYDIRKDNEGEKYGAFGVILVDKDLRDGILSEDLFKTALAKAKSAGCSYITALADTKFGRAFLERYGFEETTDPVNGQEYYRLDIE
jgi:predicted GNAT family N-acyltransferase